MSTKVKSKRTKGKKVTCEECFFHQNMLCALTLDEPCPTFREARLGLRPPQQLNFIFQERRSQTLYAFKSPNQA